MIYYLKKAHKKQRKENKIKVEVLETIITRKKYTVRKQSKAKQWVYSENSNKSFT